MDGNLLTIIFGFRNRDTLRVKRCLDSLNAQTEQGFNVIFVDYGSEPDISRDISELVKSYEFCQYLYSETRGWPWNRSRALNIGIRRAETDYVMTCDIDIVYDTRFIEQNMPLASQEIALHASCYYLPRGFKRWTEISSLTPTFRGSCTSALGLLLLSRENHRKIGAFDEFYQFWGVEDRDLEHRLNISGIKTVWLDSAESKLYHQWHPVNNNETFSFLPIGYWEEAEMYFGKNFSNPKRNTERPWGEITHRDQRPALKFLETNTSPSVTLESATKLTLANITQNIAKLFYDMSSGDSLCLENNFAPPHPLILSTINFLNRYAAMLGFGYQLMPKRDLLKDAFWLFHKNNMADIVDYAITTDERLYYLIKK